MTFFLSWCIFWNKFFFYCQKVPFILECFTSNYCNMKNVTFVVFCNRLNICPSFLTHTVCWIAIESFQSACFVKLVQKQLVNICLLGEPCPSHFVFCFDFTQIYHVLIICPFYIVIVCGKHTTQISLHLALLHCLKYQIASYFINWLYNFYFC